MPDPKMISLTIEGRTVTVPEGTSILEAAKTVGILIPHYCYHPALPVAGVCRMCLVDVEKAPKLAAACATAVADGQVISTRTEKALEARKGVLEMLLINHPLDCPICDQSGECELQDYTYQEGRQDSRYREPKRFNPVEDFGGDVVYVPNRCILCTRCVRFMDDVAHDPVLSVSERGDRAVIGKFDGADLTHEWASNVVDLCPVGALLSKDFLNKARAWELDRSASICPNCTQGCNAIIETRDNQVVRMRPRANPDVNAYFMCDTGRLDYRWINRTDRLEQPMMHVDGALTAVDWEPALAAAAAALRGKRAVVLASPMLSNESLFLLSRLGGRGMFRVTQGPEAPLEGVPDLALRADRAANVRGAEEMGFSRTAALSGVGAGDVVVIADDDLAGLDTAALGGATLIVMGTTLPQGIRGRVDVALPTTNFSEEEGTFTNLRGRVQRFMQAKAAPGLARPMWYALTDLLALLGQPTAYFIASEVFDALAAAKPSYAGMAYDTLGLRGSPLPAAQAAGRSA